MSKTYKDYNITESAIEKAEKVLSNNGVEADEVKTVLQALGYVLLDCEMYPTPTSPSEISDFTNWRDILTAEDIYECKEFIAKMCFGLNRKSLTNLIERFEKGDLKERCKVWFILVLDNRSFPCAILLAEGKVKEAYEWANTQID